MSTINHRAADMLPHDFHAHILPASTPVGYYVARRVKGTAGLAYLKPQSADGPVWTVDITQAEMFMSHSFASWARDDANRSMAVDATPPKALSPSGTQAVFRHDSVAKYGQLTVPAEIRRDVVVLRASQNGTIIDIELTPTQAEDVACKLAWQAAMVQDY